MQCLVCLPRMVQYLVQRVRCPGSTSSQNVNPLSIVCYFMPVPVIHKHNKQPCQRSFMTLKRSLACITFRRYKVVPFFREVVRRVVGLEVDPLPCSQVQPVQVCAVDVACCPSEHVQEAVYNYHCLKEKYIKKRVCKFVYTLYQTGFGKPSVSFYNISTVY